jgi:hypothetical protein
LCIRDWADTAPQPCDFGMGFLTYGFPGKTWILPSCSGSNLAMFGFKCVKLGLGGGRLDQGSCWKWGDEE